MIILDTDHISVLQHAGPNTRRLLARLEATNETVATTIITFEEMMRGWMAEINRAKTGLAQVTYYARLSQLLNYFSGWTVLPFDADAALRFEELREMRLRNIGSQDLKIAAITIRHNAHLLSANLPHFQLVPGLAVADWLHLKGEGGLGPNGN